ncbi:hypothetical protein E2K80_17735 [Rhodophyticola sp. CCM32]|uniref:SGNH hydrolase domain-containing protein n=1 Tax=Rhodophyticola sp. CCM32 TaxID=2916397 RepID=UPI00107F19C0|nr:SGNH hydrolase domain-containing protein [Rhodophyticola sp. CCM32]QBY02355.1 hypothetical protein E2K80_17735 [Rhodophyticola sp. CCM32]
MGAADGDIEFLLIGDSHAEAIASVFHSAATEADLRGLVVSRSGCPLLLDLEPNRGEPLSEQCLTLGYAVLDYAIEHDIERVVFASRWNYYFCGEPQPDCGYTQNTRFLGAAWGQNEDDRLGYLEAAIMRTLQTYQDAGISVQLVSQVPHQPYDPRRVYDLFFETSRPEYLTDMAVSASAHQSFTEHVHALMEDATSAYPSARLYDPAEILCTPGGICRIGDLRNSYYSDDDHLSLGAANLLNDWALSVLAP